MKKVESVIRLHLLEEVKEALWEMGVGGLTATRVIGYSRHHTREDSYRGVVYTVDSCPRVKLEVVVADEDLDRCVSVIRRAALSGQPGDGKLFVSTLDDVIRIRTGEHDERAL